MAEAVKSPSSHASVRKARVARRVALTSCRQRGECRGLRCCSGILTVPYMDPPKMPASTSCSILYPGSPILCARSMFTWNRPSLGYGPP